MNDIAVLRPIDGANVALFEPRQTREKLAELEGDIVRFRALKDWPQLDAAVAAKIDEQQAFVANWDASVRPNHRPETVAAGQQLSVDEAYDAWGFRKDTVSRWRISLKDTERYRAKIILGAMRPAGLEPAENHRAEGTGENEWFTPPEHVALARSVLGGIDLDPASNAIAQQTVRATRYYAREDDSLSKEWHGRVWLNPPYSQPLIGQFVEKLAVEVAAGRVSEAIMLTHNYTDTSWFQLAAATAAMIAFPKGRIRFVNADGEPCSPTQGQALFYYGTTGGEAFRNTYSSLGLVVRRA
jgi:phage N-6-adenine-methyltransferase